MRTIWFQRHNGTCMNLFAHIVRKLRLTPLYALPHTSSCVSVRPSVTGGQQKQFDLETLSATLWPLKACRICPFTQPCRQLCNKWYPNHMQQGGWAKRAYLLVILKIIVVCLCHGRSAETVWRRCYISGCWTKEARNRWSLWAPVKVLAIGTNTNFLDTPYIN